MQYMGEPEFDATDIAAALPWPAADSPDNPELVRLYEADQADRRDGHVSSATSGRDRERRERVLEILSVANPSTATDRFHAAMVLQHGYLPEHFELAHALARAAADAGYRKARWLSAATIDRYLMSIEQPQRYGTQLVDVGSGWHMHEVDAATTDDERAQWDVPPLEDLQRRADELNAEEVRHS